MTDEAVLRDEAVSSIEQIGGETLKAVVLILKKMAGQRKEESKRAQDRQVDWDSFVLPGGREAARTSAVPSDVLLKRIKQYKGKVDLEIDLATMRAR